jgi:uncharacterized protein involved in response to NO
MSAGQRKLALLSYGFRPFFLAALLFAFLTLAAWVHVRGASLMPLPHLAPQLWHGHEMLFGFFGAAIAGFLLTAVPSWTGARGFAGWPLALLITLWVLGRAAFAFATALPVRVIAVAELSFLPVLACMLAPPLLRAKNRNTPLLLVLVVFWLVDATFLCALALGDHALASSTLRAGMDVVLLLITVIGGRIVPAFTANALRRRGIDAPLRTHGGIEAAVISMMIAVLAADIFAPASLAAAIVAALAAAAHAVRMAGWQSLRTLREPIVWVLHLAYAWLPIGLALKAIHLSAHAPWAADWFHALSVGAAATMVVAVITRASLGHTGRELIVSRAVAVAYAVLGVAALLRTTATAVPPAREWLIKASAAFWLIAFGTLLVVYAPILLRPRVDGREG